MNSGFRFDMKMRRSTALGPIVVQLRSDTLSKAGKQIHVDTIAAVFVMAHGKIREQSDYFAI